MPSSVQLHRATPTAGLGPGPRTGTVFTSYKQGGLFIRRNLTDETVSCGMVVTAVPDNMARYHTHVVGPNQCCSYAVQTIEAPVEAVWAVVRRFDKPQAYKKLIKSCDVIFGDGEVGSLREVHVVSGLPAAFSTERLEILDDERHVLSFSVVGGEHRLNNYRSVTTLHERSGGGGTVVVESYVVDVPAGNTKEDTCVFVETILRCNLQSLAGIAENMARITEIGTN